MPSKMRETTETKVKYAIREDWNDSEAFGQFGSWKTQEEAQQVIDDNPDWYRGPTAAHNVYVVRVTTTETYKEERV